MAFTLTPAYGQGGTYTAQNDRLVMQSHTDTGGVKKLTVASGGAMTGDLAVTTTGAGNGSVQVASGGVVVPWTSTSGQGHYFAYNDAATTVGAFAANASGNTRIDLVSVQITDAGVGAPTVAFVITQGTPSGAPVAPSVPANATPIATVAIPNGFTVSTTVSNANITDVRRKSYLPDVSATSTNATVIPSPTAGNIAYRVDDQRLNQYNASAVEGARWENVPERTGFRNMIINGAMQVAQRSTSVAGITATGYYTLDRWNTQLSSLGTFTMSQTADAPAGSDFRNCVKYQCTTAQASPVAGAFLTASQIVEGQDLQMIRKGTANAKPVTISFWVKAFQTGTFILELLDNTNSRSISASYTVVSSGTWEFKTVTFAADTTGQFANDSTGALTLNWWLGAGSSFSSGSLQTAWATSVTANRAVGTTNVASSTSNYWQMTGVQFELGSVPSQFERRPIQTELALCQRYFQLHPSEHRFSYQQSQNGLITNIYVPVPMRGTAAVAVSSVTSGVGGVFLGNTPSSFWYTFATYVGVTIVTSGLGYNIGLTFTGGLTAAVYPQFGTLRVDISLSAEL